MNILGIDIGCTSIKYGLICLGNETKVYNFDTISISQTHPVEEYTTILESIIYHASDYTAVGFGFPSVVQGNKILRQDINFDKVWSKVQDTLNTSSVPSFAVNDADAAGIAEVNRREAADLRTGVTIVLTLGTGIGSALFMDGKLLPNSELGLIKLHGMEAEHYAAPSVKSKESLSIQKWASRLQEYLDEVETILMPDHLVLGGGITSDFGVYQLLLKTRVPFQIAFYRNQAGVVGAAIYAAFKMHSNA